jgi:hypothetical protein
MSVRGLANELLLARGTVGVRAYPLIGDLSPFARPAARMAAEEAAAG